MSRICAPFFKTIPAIYLLDRRSDAVMHADGACGQGGITG